MKTASRIVAAASLLAFAWLGVGTVWALDAAAGRVIRIGPEREIRTLQQASRLVRDGDILEVDAGDYRRDVAVWTHDRLEFRAVGGRVRLLADGASAEGKGIWVVRGGTVSVDGFDFIGARVPDRNGAGIRFEKGVLRIRDCRFLDNENGILTASDGESALEISNSEFARNGFGDGQSHNLYVGAIARLTVTGSYFHHARVGHLLKSRARESRILYNRLTDEIGGTASYELEFPNGGVAYVIGNLIQQSSTTENPHIIAYGAEGYRGENNHLYLANNTLVDGRTQGGVFLRLAPGTRSVLAINNILVGNGSLESAGPGTYRNNFNAGWEGFERAARDDYRLAADSPLRFKGVEPPQVGRLSLRPEQQYVHPRSSRPLRVERLSPGAFQVDG
ncbi:right-handed parallel beta-helix repeat-containing protein [Rhodocyclus tenuis]|uniref:Right handed beta helix domain-containing protein n=1 Tax=Rhodocyclus tenuis TaxID=1066 RepID=A0A840GI59_RHOTE|nr:hypothetical protein [Rhodocyclus tenuis]MBB4247869.1 hypothetical protein [Rhodocyclus tenuis]